MLRALLYRNKGLTLPCKVKAGLMFGRNSRNPIRIILGKCHPPAGSPSRVIIRILTEGKGKKSLEGNFK